MARWIALLVCASVIGCPSEKKKDDDKSTSDDESASKKKKKKDKTEDSEEADEGDWSIPKFGQKNCDEYLDKLVKCSKKMSKAHPEMAKAAKKSATDAVKHWNETIENGVKKADMGPPCKAALDGISKAYSTYCPGVFDDET